VEHDESLSEAERFGTFLRKVRERKRLSLDAVEEISAAYSERLTKSHLSRIENGLAEPSVRKLFALSQIYDMPLTSMAERFEIDLQREQRRIDVTGKSPEEIRAEVNKLLEGGRYVEALLALTAAIDEMAPAAGQAADDDQARWVRRARLGIADCLIHLGRYEAAKRETEELLSDPALTREENLRLLECFVICCFRLGRLTVATMGLERAERELDRYEVAPKIAAEFAMLRGNIASFMELPEEALEAYARALRIYEEISVPFEACRVRVNMSWVLIQKEEYEAAREQLEAALLVAEASSYDRLRAYAMSHLAILAYRQDDMGAAESWAIRSNSIARPREYLTLVFRNCYYLMKIAEHGGDETGVNSNLRTLRALLSKVDDNLPEAEAFRAATVGGES
jgi:transcriptional regulator with XRE-family HTH domain